MEEVKGQTLANGWKCWLDEEDAALALEELAARRLEVTDTAEQYRILVER